MNQIFKKDEFIIIPFFKGRKQEFMVVNTKKEFKNGHTHLKSFKMAKYLINLARCKKINSGLRPYLLTSLKRISKDQEYIEKLEEILAIKKNKGQKSSYYNRAIWVKGTFLTSHFGTCDMRNVLFFIHLIFKPLIQCSMKFYWLIVVDGVLNMSILKGFNISFLNDRQYSLHEW